MSKSPLDSILRDRDLRAELIKAGILADGATGSTGALESLTADVRLPGGEFQEAIIVLFGRPALLVQNGTFEVPHSGKWKGILFPAKSRLERAITAVGRIELRNHPTYDWVGTGWLVADHIIMTNRHVALEFAEAKGSGRNRSFSFKLSPDRVRMAALLDFREEHNQAAQFEVAVKKVLYIAEPGSANPDVGILEIERHPDLPEPIRLAAKTSKVGANVAVVGYPANLSEG